MEENRPDNDYRHLVQHQANERTFLAWMRTAIAIMGFGFVVEKFSLIANQIAFALTGKSSIPVDVYYAHVGLIFIIIATILTPIIYVRYKVGERQIIDELYNRNTYLELSLIVIVFSMGILFVAHLLKIF
jgi:putative membrane protein